MKTRFGLPVLAVLTVIVVAACTDAGRSGEATPLADGAYRITMTLGWGDRPSGCISTHTWAFRVAADGQMTLLEETGDPAPEGDLPPG